MSKDLYIERIQLKEKYEIRHKPGYEYFIVINRGAVNILINQEKFENVSECVFNFSISGLKRISICSSDAVVWLLTLSKLHYPDFFFESSLTSNLERHVNLESSCLANLNSLCDMIAFELNNNPKNIKIVQQLVSSFMSIYNSEFLKSITSQEFGKQNFHLVKLFELIENNFKSKHSLDFYANHLVLSTRQLNNITHKYLGTTLSNLINRRKIVEAQLQLKSSTKTIAEIAYEIGFEEKSYFSRVFRKYVSFSPLKYRQSFNHISE